MLCVCVYTRVREKESKRLLDWVLGHSDSCLGQKLGASDGAGTWPRKDMLKALCRAETEPWAGQGEVQVGFCALGRGELSVTLGTAPLCLGGGGRAQRWLLRLRSSVGWTFGPG